MNITPILNSLKIITIEKDISIVLLILRLYIGFYIGVGISYDLFIVSNSHAIMLDIFLAVIIILICLGLFSLLVIPASIVILSFYGWEIFNLFEQGYLSILINSSLLLSLAGLAITGIGYYSLDRILFGYNLMLQGYIERRAKNISIIHRLILPLELKLTLWKQL